MRFDSAGSKSLFFPQRYSEWEECMIRRVLLLSTDTWIAIQCVRIGKGLEYGIKQV